MHKPFEAGFQIEGQDEQFATIRINNKSGELYFFPKWELFSKGFLNFEKSHEDIKTYDKLPDHFSWHKDGIVHMKYRNDKKIKTIITQAEEEFKSFNSKTLLPILSFSVRIEDKECSILCLITEKDIVKNLELLPEPYSRFVIQGQKNKHVVSLFNSENVLEFAHMFIQIPVFTPIDDKKSSFCITAPLQNDDLFKISPKIKEYLINSRLTVKDLKPKNDKVTN